MAALIVATGLGSCRKAESGWIDVTVIGEPPKLVDPTTAKLSTADALLIGNVAQGLVRFDPRGQIDAGLAERWNVSDDGLSYIFRLQSDKWPSGRKIDAREVARLLNRARRETSLDPMKDTLDAIEEIVAMTERVIEIRLIAPRPNLLELLAQPEFAIVRPVDGTNMFEGGGPFILSARKPDHSLHLQRTTAGADGDQEVREDVRLRGLPAGAAVARFKAGASNGVFGGDFSNLGLAQAGGVTRGALRFDPVAGLFALIPARSGGPLADPMLRSLLSRAIDREALVAAFGVEGLTPRTTLLQPGLEGIGDIASPSWATVSLPQRRASLVAEANRFFGKKARPVLAVNLPAGSGAAVLFDRLKADWGGLGVGLAPAAVGQAADLKLIDEVAASTSPAWFVRRFRCGRVPLCDVDVDALADAARDTQSPEQRSQFLATAAQRIDRDVLLIPLAAPIRWSLVSPDLPGFVENRFARHTLVALGFQLARDRSE